MPKVLVSIQQGAVARSLIPRLEAALRKTYAEQLGGGGLLVLWAEVPRGQAYTEGRLSDVSWLMIEVEDGLDQARREAAMMALAEAFARGAGVKVDRLMVTLCDGALFGEYLAANRRRMRPLARVVFTVRMVFGILASKRREGFASIDVNYVGGRA